MLKVSIPNLKPGMIIARSIINAEGFLLLGSGVVLTESYIKRLEECDISAVYIRNGIAGLEEKIPEVLREQTQIRAIKMVKKAFDRFALNQKVNMSKIGAIAQSIVEELILNRNTLLHLTDIRGYDEYTFGHSVNVCILSVFTGIALGYDRRKLKELALGGLLHDIGKTLIPPEILNKPGRLSKEEMAIVETHTSIGFGLLRKNLDLVTLIAHVAFQHHERMNGTGYPRGLREGEIHQYARIVAVADVYDALTSDRPYRKAMLPHEAYEILMASSAQHFDANILKVFFSHIAIYPSGTFVQLSTQEIGIVTNASTELPLRPVVKTILDAEGNICNQPHIINLTKELTTFIIKVFQEEEVLTLCERLKVDQNTDLIEANKKIDCTVAQSP